MRGKRRIKRTKGETRADAVLELCETVGEHLYKPYISMVRHMRQVVAGKPMTSTPINFGTMVNQLVKEEPQSLLVDKDVHWLRNGSSHGHHKYLPDLDSIELWDTNHPHQVFKVEELAERVYTWVRMSSHMVQYRYTWSLSKNWPEIFKMSQQVFKGK
jgi:hypothetical protein